MSDEEIIELTLTGERSLQYGRDVEAMALDLIRSFYQPPELALETRGQLAERVWAMSCDFWDHWYGPCDHSDECEHPEGNCPLGEIMPLDVATGRRTCDHMHRISGIGAGVTAEMEVIADTIVELTGGDVSEVEAVIAQAKDLEWTSEAPEHLKARYSERVRDAVRFILEQRGRFPGEYEVDERDQRS
ncbi:MAG: hypothetical protein F4152_03605 [Dehalococcoidia bacterium]|nr:hypothetical protein [Acidobacteriota bacterium]MYH67658.1 hypothetical protein [Dehalococcoidia bacterium]